MEKEEAKALASAVGSEKKKLTPTQLVILKDLAKGHEIAHKMTVPIVYKDPNELTISPNNSRKTVNQKALEGLTTSIREVGISIPIIINTKDQVVIGKRRWLVAKRIGLHSIPCSIRRYNSALEEKMHSFRENVMFVPLSDKDRARAFRDLHDGGGMSFQKIANILGTSEEYVRYYYEMKKEDD